VGEAHHRLRIVRCDRHSLRDTGATASAIIVSRSDEIRRRNFAAMSPQIRAELALI
jgi:hypothetical protein